MVGLILLFVYVVLQLHYIHRAKELRSGVSDTHKHLHYNIKSEGWSNVLLPGSTFIEEKASRPRSTSTNIKLSEDPEAHYYLHLLDGFEEEMPILSGEEMVSLEKSAGPGYKYPQDFWVDDRGFPHPKHPEHDT